MVGEFPGLANLDAERQPAGDQRLPRHVLLAARAVARARRRPDHPRRLRLRPADAGEGVSGRLAASRALVVLALRPRAACFGRRRAGRRRRAPGSSTRSGSSSTSRGTASAARSCAQALVDLRPARRAGDAAPARRPAPARAGADRRPQPAPDRNPKPPRRGQSGRVLLHPLPARSQRRRVTVELNNQGEDPHNLNLRREGDEGEPPCSIAETGSLPAQRRRASTSRRAPTASGATSPNTRNRDARDADRHWLASSSWRDSDAVARSSTSGFGWPIEPTSEMSRLNGRPAVQSRTARTLRAAPGIWLMW